MAGLAETISGFNANRRLLISFTFAALAWLVSLGRLQFATHLIATWDAYALSALALLWVSICYTPHQEIRKRVQRQDVAGPLITIFVIAAASAALLAVIFLLRQDKNSAQSHLIAHVALTLIAVLSSWALVHTVFALHYAHSFYGDGEDPKQLRGGLEFPGEKRPDYLDFAYFSIVVGMTFQVSDVQVTSQSLRRLVLLHGVLSFAFNTLILALAINTVTSLV